jgi:IS30 family transposase
MGLINGEHQARLRSELPRRPKEDRINPLWERHHRIAQLAVLGMTNIEIAEELNCHKQTVSNVRNSPAIQRQMAIMKGAADSETVDVAKRIQELAPKCVDVLENILDDDQVDAKTRAASAVKMLDRAGYAPVKTALKLSKTYMSEDDIAEINRRAVEAGKAAGVVVEAEYSEVQN